MLPVLYCHFAWFTGPPRAIENLADGNCFLIVYRRTYLPLGNRIASLGMKSGVKSEVIHDKAELVEDVARARNSPRRCRALSEIVFESIIETLNHGERLSCADSVVFVSGNVAHAGPASEDWRPRKYSRQTRALFQTGQRVKELINIASPQTRATSESSLPTNSDESRQPPIL